MYFQIVDTKQLLQIANKASKRVKYDKALDADNRITQQVSDIRQ